MVTAPGTAAASRPAPGRTAPREHPGVTGEVVVGGTAPLPGSPSSEIRSQPLPGWDSHSQPRPCSRFRPAGKRRSRFWSRPSCDRDAPEQRSPPPRGEPSARRSPSPKWGGSVPTAPPQTQPQRGGGRICAPITRGKLRRVIRTRRRYHNLDLVPKRWRGEGWGGEGASQAPLSVRPSLIRLVKAITSASPRWGGDDSPDGAVWRWQEEPGAGLPGRAESRAFRIIPEGRFNSVWGNCSQDAPSRGTSLAPSPPQFRSPVPADGSDWEGRTPPQSVTVVNWSPSSPSERHGSVSGAVRSSEGEVTSFRRALPTPPAGALASLAPGADYSGVWKNRNRHFISKPGEYLPHTPSCCSYPLPDPPPTQGGVPGPRRALGRPGGKWGANGGREGGVSPHSDLSLS